MPYVDKTKQKLYFKTRIKRNCNLCNKYYEGSGNQFCSTSCSAKSTNPGRKHTEESKLKIGISSKGRKHTNNSKLKISLLKRGNKNPMWKGGISPINLLIRRTVKYKNWRLKVFKRDNYTCQWCGVVGTILHADHIKPFSLFPKLRFKLSNGRTLCVNCHEKTDTYKGKISKIKNENKYRKKGVVEK